MVNNITLSKNQILPVLTCHTFMGDIILFELSQSTLETILILGRMDLKKKGLSPKTLVYTALLLPFEVNFLYIKEI